MPYRDAEILLPCPRCGASLARDLRSLTARCLEGCGDFLTFPALSDRFGDALDRARPSSMWWKTSATSCPYCATPMRAMVLDDDGFYRCAEHGSWFDAGSPVLGTSLERVRSPDVPRQPSDSEPVELSAADLEARRAAREASRAAEAREAREAEIRRLADALEDADDDTRRELAIRLVDAERRIQALEREVATLRQLMGRE